MKNYIERRYPIVLPEYEIPSTSALGKWFGRKETLPAVLSHWRVTRVYDFMGEKMDFHVNLDPQFMEEALNLEEYLDHHFKRAVAKYMDSA
jgi:hypothetical protein